MKTYVIAAVWTFSMVLWGCEEEPGPGNNSGGNNSDDEWLIPKSQIYDGGPGKDGIPALTIPNFIQADQEDYVKDNDLVSIKASPEFATNNDPNSPTNSICTSLFSRPRLAFLLQYGLVYIRYTLRR